MQTRRAGRRATRRPIHGALVMTLALTASAVMTAPSIGHEQPRFDGVTITVAGPAGQIEGAQRWIDEWEANTGGTVEVLSTDSAELETKILSAAGTGAHFADVYNIGTQLSGQLMSLGAVLEVPESTQARFDTETLAPLYRNFQLVWGDTMYAAPWGCDMLMMYHRKDLLGDPALSEQFEAEFGRPLMVPTTWAEYEDIAHFLDARQGLQTTYPGFGLLEVTRPTRHLWSGFFTRAASYAKHPDDPAFFFDTETMQPRINNPGFVRALEDWTRALQYAQPDIQTLSGGGVRQAFIAGGAPLAVHWADLAPYSHDPNESVVDGLLGYSMVPGSPEVYNALTGEWEQLDTPNQAPFAGYGGWLFVVPTQTSNAEAAFDFLGHMGSKATLNAASKVQGTAANPCYIDGLDDTAGWIEAGFHPEEVEAYTGAIKSSITHPNAILELRIPGVVEYRDALELGLSEVISGQKEPQAALDEVAANWEAITDRLGRESQREFYAASLGL